MDRNRRKTALVTGASSGIGEAIARELASRAIDLVLVSENGGELERVRADITATSDISVLTLQCDLFATGAAEEIHDWCGNRGISIDILVNCAGIFLNIDRELTDTGCIDDILNLHVVNLTKLSLLFSRGMKERKEGYILNVSSIASYFVDPASLTYGPTKCYIRSFSAELHCEMKPYNVGVTCVMPGATMTNFFSHNDSFVPPLVKRSAMSAKRCAELSVKAMFRRKMKTVPGIVPKIQLFFFRTVVRPSTYAMVKKNYFSMKQKHSEKELNQKK